MYRAGRHRILAPCDDCVAQVFLVRACGLLRITIASNAGIDTTLEIETLRRAILDDDIGAESRTRLVKNDEVYEPRKDMLAMLTQIQEWTGGQFWTAASPALRLRDGCRRKHLSNLWPPKLRPPSLAGK